jgi:LacI family transcriptional regulator
MPVTLKDIAVRVGKSIPTVSRALAGFEDISPQTREEVQRVAREMGYVPNITGRNLQKQRTDTIALILPSSDYLKVSDPFFSEFLSGIVTQTTQDGFNLNISAGDLPDETEIYLSHYHSRRADGFIVVRTRRQDHRVNLLRENNVPFVAYGRTQGENDFYYVDGDDTLGIRQVVDHLADMGHTRLAFIAEPSTFTKSFNRLQGFLQGLQAHNLTYYPQMVVEANFRQRSGSASAHQLLTLPEPPTAIVASNDLLALGAESAARELGLTVGREVSITGYDDILLAALANPPLTTVYQPAERLGAMVARMLISIIQGAPPEEKHIIVAPLLVPRPSSAPPQPHR